MHYFKELKRIELELSYHLSSFIFLLQQNYQWLSLKQESAISQIKEVKALNKIAEWNPSNQSKNSFIKV